MAALLQFNSAGGVIRGFNPREDVSLVLVPTTVTHVSGGTLTKVLDAEVLVQSGVIVDTTFVVQLTDSSTEPGAVLSNLTPGIAGNIGNDLIATWVANGSAQVKAVHPERGTRIATAAVGRNTSGTANLFEAWVSSPAHSLAYDIQNPLDSAINALGVPSPANLDAFSSITLGSAATRNSGLWCSSLVDLTGSPVWNAPSGGSPRLNFGGVLISPRHILGASHVQVTGGGVGGTVTFLGNDRALRTATVLSTAMVFDDLSIAYLSADIPTGQFGLPNHVTPFAALPATMNSYLPTCTSAPNTYPAALSWLPFAHLNQNQEVLLLEAIALSSTMAQEIYVRAPQASNRITWGYSPTLGKSDIQSGDSGSPVFTFLPGSTTPILLFTCHTYSGGPFVTANLAGVNAAMNALATAQGDARAGSYAMTTVSLSGYPTTF